MKLRISKSTKSLLLLFSFVWFSCDIFLYVDECGVIDGDNNSCKDCTGLINGDAIEDECGVCGGSGIPDGACDCAGNVEDCAGECGGNVVEDCAGECGGSAPDTDGDGICDWNEADSYGIVQIGTQLWMAENLKVTHYKDGTEIPTGYSDNDWTNLSTGAYGVQVNNISSNADTYDTYGNLYNWYAVDDNRGVCPEGWHVPSDEEFMELEMFLGMSEEEANSEGERGTDEGSKLAGSSELWIDYGLPINPNTTIEANSEFGTSGFNALPGGYRYSETGGCFGLGRYGYFWSSSKDTPEDISAWCRLLFHNNTDVRRYLKAKQSGFYIRCLGD